MSFDLWEIILIILGMVVVIYIIFISKKRTQRLTKKNQTLPFFLLGITWVIAGIFYGVISNIDFFNFGIFNLGLIFTVAGGASLLKSFLKKKKKPVF